ncbi:hypothetical protein BH23CHL8_BH23CHL8_21610 [soil metagenome]
MRTRAVGTRTPDEEVITDALAIGLHSAVGIPVITDGNAPEVYVRMHIPAPPQDLRGH